MDNLKAYMCDIVELLHTMCSVMPAGGEQPLVTLRIVDSFHDLTTVQFLIVYRVKQKQLLVKLEILGGSMQGRTTGINTYIHTYIHAYCISSNRHHL